MRRLRQGPHDGVCDVERVEPDVAVLGRLRVEAARLRGRPVCVARGETGTVRHGEEYKGRAGAA